MVKSYSPAGRIHSAAWGEEKVPCIGHTSGPDAGEAGVTSGAREEHMVPGACGCAHGPGPGPLPCMSWLLQVEIQAGRHNL